MDKTTCAPFSDSLILAQWVIGKTQNELLEMPERFRGIISEMEEDEDIYGPLILLKVNENYLFCHFRKDQPNCTKSILELTARQIDLCREYCVKRYSRVGEQKWINTEYETIISFIYSVSMNGHIECRSSQGVEIPVWRKIQNLFKGRKRHVGQSKGEIMKLYYFSQIFQMPYNFQLSPCFEPAVDEIKVLPLSGLKALSILTWGKRV